MQAKGRKGGSAPSRETAADAGIQSRAQGQAAESGGCQVQAMSRWEALHTGIEGGEWVKNERSSTMNSCGWGGVRKEDGKERSGKQ